MNNLQKEWQKLLDQWYEHDQHFDSPLLDRIYEIEKELKKMERLTGKYCFKKKGICLVLYVEVAYEEYDQMMDSITATKWRKATEEDLPYLNLILLNGLLI